MTVLEEIELREKELSKKRRRDKIADIFIVIAILGVSFYNVNMVKNVERNCIQDQQKLILGLTSRYNFSFNSDGLDSHVFDSLNNTCRC